ncbi:hypothetical protein B0H13DRAFT_2328420 [Mycena leptocephala]|nr:hypothetical protein B0H13DRAFT_2328420 [Mycena leptocephala]
MFTKSNIAAVTLLLSLLIHVSAQTLYTVSAGTLFNPWANATITISAIGTGADGGTTYVEVATAAKLLYHPGVWEPYTGDSGTTFVADASGFRESAGFRRQRAETCTSVRTRAALRRKCRLNNNHRCDLFGPVVAFYTLIRAHPPLVDLFQRQPSQTAHKRSITAHDRPILWCCSPRTGLPLPSPVSQWF